MTAPLSQLTSACHPPLQLSYHALPCINCRSVGFVWVCRFGRTVKTDYISKGSAVHQQFLPRSMAGKFVQQGLDAVGLANLKEILKPQSGQNVLLMQNAAAVNAADSKFAAILREAKVAFALRRVAHVAGNGAVILAKTDDSAHFEPLSGRFVKTT